jgi:hypothetical protein
LRSALGWPLRRALNPRVQWTVAEVDSRLGSQGGARPPLHARLDVLEARLAAIDERTAALAAQTAALVAGFERLARQVELDRLATDEGLSAALEGLRQLHSALEEVAAAPLATAD